MAFYTDWYDFESMEDFLKLPQRIKNDSKIKGGMRPETYDIEVLINNLSEIYSRNSKIGFTPQVGKVVSDTLIELGKAAQINALYKKALLKESTFLKYCSLFTLVFYENQKNLLFLRDLCKEFKKDVKMTDLITGQHIIFLQRNIEAKKSSVLIKQLKTNIK